MEFLDQVLERADRLMQNAPGHVRVKRISHIDEVRVLRAARDVLTEDEQAELPRARLAVIERLDGAASPTRTPEEPASSGLVASLMARITSFSQRQQQGELAHVLAANESGPIAEPAPDALIDAAEAWLIAHIVAGRIELDLEPLKAPWQDASIEPAPPGP